MAAIYLDYLPPGDRFRHRRQAMGLSQVELATLLGTSNHVISYWELGHRGIPKRSWRMLDAIEAELAQENNPN